MEFLDMYVSTEMLIKSCYNSKSMFECKAFYICKMDNNFSQLVNVQSNPLVKLLASAENN